MKQAERNHRAGAEIGDDLMALVFPPSSRRIATAEREFLYCQDTDQLAKGQQGTASPRAGYPFG
jgi:hypothetical protein